MVMALRAEYTLHKSDLNDFLEQGICEEKNGTVLSVLSLFARNGVDPWQEAARLAGMPRLAATEILKTMIAGLSAGPASRDDPRVIASRLVDILPDRGTTQPVRRPRSPAVTRTSWSTRLVQAFALIVL
ncbi:MAG: hypothetical protein RLO50_11420, partial [Azospirillaceae bacterium]